MLRDTTKTEEAECEKEKEPNFLKGKKAMCTNFCPIKGNTCPTRIG